MATDTPRKGPMTDEELLALIAQYEKASLGSSVAAGATISTTSFPSNQAMTTLEMDRFSALNMYMARPLGNEVENRSQVVIPELRDTVEWIMPQLMRMFVAAKQICRFEAEGPNDVDQAQLETAVVNHVLMKDNNGFFVLHDYFKDALLLRNGYVKVYWCEEKQTRTERYTGLNQIEVASLLGDDKDEEVEVLEQREYQRDLPMNLGQVGAPAPAASAQSQPGGGQPPPRPPQQGMSGALMQQGPQTGLPMQPPQMSASITVFDLKIRRTEKVGKVKVECIPPEEVLVSSRARSNVMDDVPFSMHKTEMTRSELIAEGHPRDIVETLSPGKPNWLDIDALARNQVTDQSSIENPGDRAMQEIEVRECTIKVDADGDGMAEMRRVLVAGDKILENEEIEESPLASCSPIRMPHRHTGISYYDLISDLQIIKTTLFRQGMDNLAIANNMRVGVDWKNVNLDDLLTSRPGGVVRTNGPPSAALFPIETPSNLVQQVIPALQYVDSLREMRTGVGRDTMGLDADALADVTKGGQLAAMSAASLKIELVARLLAEGVKDVFTKIHGAIMRHQDKPLQFELSGKWIEVDPASWRKRSRVAPTVGLGSGNREEARANIMLLGSMQEKVASFGLIGPKQAYETFKSGAEILGFQPERFAMDPASPEYAQHQQEMAQNPPPPAPPVQVAQIRAQSEQAKAQGAAQREVLKLQGQLATAQSDAAAAHERSQAEIMHAAIQGNQDRQMEVVGHHADMAGRTMEMNNARELALIKAFSTILAAQLKQNATADAGQMLARDVRETEAGL